MSPNRVTMTRAEAIRRRREEEQKRRDSLTHKRVNTPKPAPAQPKLDRTPARLKTRDDARSKPAPVKAAAPATTSRHGRRYDIAMSSPSGRVAGVNKPQAPSIKLPRITFGARWLSFLLVAACGSGLYLMFSMEGFIVHSTTIAGNKRVSSQEISSVLGVMGKPAAYLNPAQIEYNILATYPDIGIVKVDVNLPADVIITVSERQPVAAWQQDGQIVWVDAQGYAFPARGLVEGLVTVFAVSAPPPPDLNVEQTIGARPFLSTEMAAALLTLSPHIPQDSALIYDPRYGLGWTDPRGWQVYFGHSGNDITVKLQVYQSMLDFLTQRSISPRLISVEYPNAPFYRVEQQQ